MVVPQRGFDEHVLPQLLHQMSQEADPVFKEHLTKCLNGLFANGHLDGECHLHADGSVKSVHRMEAGAHTRPLFTFKVSVFCGIVGAFRGCSGGV